MGNPTNEELNDFANAIIGNKRKPKIERLAYIHGLIRGETESSIDFRNRFKIYCGHFNFSYPWIFDN